MIKKIPVYCYQSGIQKGPANIQLTIDHDFYTKYGTSPSYPSYLKQWSNLHETSLTRLINNEFEFPVINSMIEHYVGMAAGNVMADDFSKMFNLIGFTPKFMTGLTRSDETRGYENVTYKTLNNQEFNLWTSAPIGYIVISSNTQIQLLGCCNPNSNFDYINLYITDHTATIYVTVFDDDLFTDTGEIKQDGPGVRFQIGVTFNAALTEITNVTVVTSAITTYAMWRACYPRFNLNGTQSSDEDNENPYAPYNDGGDGGGGDYINPDLVDATEIPSLPSLGATDFITIYNPTGSQLNSFAQFLWSAAFDLDTFKKIFQDPFDCIMGLNIVPCIPSSMGTKHIKLGNVDTEVSSSYCASQWAEVDCGSVKISTTVNCFMDYSPHVKIHLFLPFIGFEPLSVDDIMGGSIQVVYHVDVVSGDLVAFVKHSSKGVLYSYNGNCAATIPVTAANFGRWLNNYYQQIASVVPAMANGGVMGGAAGAAAGGLNQAFNAAGSIISSYKPDIARGGSMSGAAGIMGVKKPFIIIERPNISVPNYVERYAGISANKTVSLGSCSGFTQVDYVHIDNVHATSDEIAEIENYLHEGVIF